MISLYQLTKRSPLESFIKDKILDIMFRHNRTHGDAFNLSKKINEVTINVTARRTGKNSVSRWVRSIIAPFKFEHSLEYCVEVKDNNIKLWWWWLTENDVAINLFFDHFIPFIPTSHFNVDQPLFKIRVERLKGDCEDRRDLLAWVTLLALKDTRVTKFPKINDNVIELTFSGGESSFLKIPYMADQEPQNTSRVPRFYLLLANTRNSLYCSTECHRKDNQ